MEVVLLERIEKLGLMGDVVTVRDGYARNFLLPQNKALRATKANLAQFESQRAQLEARNLELKQEAEAIAGRMAGLKVVVVRQAGDTGQLYGSVSNRDIADALTEAGYTVDRRQVMLAQPIKTLGLETVRIVLHPEVTLTIDVNIARNASDAEVQAETGTAVFEETTATVNDEDAIDDETA